ncbi:MAG: DUF1538 domain-containing protein [Clostridiales bacterium]|nr:DUF1538 domain-containing protein [Clostridiales bacterium]
MMNLKETFNEVVYAIIPIVALVLLLQFTVVNLPMDVLVKFIGGAVMIVLGLVLFMAGSKIGFIPVGETIGSSIVKKGKLWIVLFFGFLLGFVITVAEPDVQVLASQIDNVTGGSIAKPIVVSTIALGVGIFVGLGLLRIFLRVPIFYLVTVGYSLAFALALVTSPEFVAVAFDAGGVMTGPLAVPFIMSLGLGVSAVIGKKGDKGDDSFGMIGLTMLGPTLAVLIMGVFFR